MLSYYTQLAAKIGVYRTAKLMRERGFSLYMARRALLGKTKGG